MAAQSLQENALEAEDSNLGVLAACDDASLWEIYANSFN
jgi:hypothetical protein